MFILNIINLDASVRHVFFVSCNQINWKSLGLALRSLFEFFSFHLSLFVTVFRLFTCDQSSCVVSLWLSASSNPDHFAFNKNFVFFWLPKFSYLHILDPKSPLLLFVVFSCCQSTTIELAYHLFQIICIVIGRMLLFLSLLLLARSSTLYQAFESLAAFLSLFSHSSLLRRVSVFCLLIFQNGAFDAFRSMIHLLVFDSSYCCCCCLTVRLVLPLFRCQLWMCGRPLTVVCQLLFLINLVCF